MHTHFHIFLAHAKEDKALVREVFFLLQLDGFTPWLDTECLLPGQDWEFEIKKAVRESYVVVLFISASGVDRAGYLHKEISLAVDIAEQQPQGRIFIIPILLGECKMPERLQHLQWLCSRQMPWQQGPFGIPEIYSALQSSLLFRALELGLVTQEELNLMVPKRFGGKGEGPLPLQPGQYLIRGQNPNGTPYYGIAKIKISDKKYQMVSNISGHVATYEGDVPEMVYQDVNLRGDYEVTYAPQRWTGTYHGTWDGGGVEDLIPASPLVSKIIS